jgi:hypothetical protein
VVEFYSWFVLLSSEKNEPFGLLFLLTPPLIAVRYPRIRGTAREEFRSGSLFICDEQREEAIFF